MVIGTAVAAHAGCIVTSDGDLHEAALAARLRDECGNPGVWPNGLLEALSPASEVTFFPKPCASRERKRKISFRKSGTGALLESAPRFVCGVVAGLVCKSVPMIYECGASPPAACGRSNLRTQQAKGVAATCKCVLNFQYEV